jgi:hypothetical protein
MVRNGDNSETMRVVCPIKQMVRKSYLTSINSSVNVHKNRPKMNIKFKICNTFDTSISSISEGFLTWYGFTDWEIKYNIVDS